MPRKLVRAIAAIVGCACLLGGALAAPAVAAPSPVVPIVIVGQQTHIVGVNQGLPPLSPVDDYVAGSSLAEVITAYRDSGDYVSDQRAVARAAQKFLDSWLSENCESPTSCNGKRPTAVFDIDDTLLSWYAAYSESDFAMDASILEKAGGECLTPAIVPVREFLRHAKRIGVSVYLISGRSNSERAGTISCLNKRGVSGWDGMILRTPPNMDWTAARYKSAARAELERRGHVIITSIGDQLSDSTDGFTVRGFRLPNPMYFIA